MNIVLKTNQGKQVVFWTNADIEIVEYTIITSYNRYDMIMKWDRDTITHDLDWVAYHLRRNGYKIMEEKGSMRTKIFNNVKPMKFK